MTQQSLFDQFTPASTYPVATRRVARERIRMRAGSVKCSVFAHIAAAGAEGRTDEEIRDELGLSESTARPRRHELVAAGLVVDSGRQRRTRSGRDAIVWVVRPRDTAPPAPRVGREILRRRPERTIFVLGGGNAET